MSRGRLLPCALAALLAGFAVPADADWLQAGHDAARTGNAGGTAPAWPDVALRLAISDEGGFSLWPDSLLVVGRTAYVTVQDKVFAVDLERGDVRSFATVGGFVRSLASDGTRLFALGPNHVWAVDLATGATAWDRPVTLAPAAAPDPVPAVVPPAPLPPDVCAHPAVHNLTLFVACIEPLSDGRRIVADALDTATGASRWPAPWMDAAAEQEGATVPRALVGLPGEPFSLQMSAMGGYVFVAATLASATGGSWQASSQVYAIRIADGTGMVVDGDAMPAATAAGGGLLAPPAPTGDAQHAFVKGRFVLRYPLTPLAGAAGFDANRNIRPGPEDDVGAGFAYDGSHVFVTTRSTLHRFDRDLRTDVGFATVRLPEGEAWAAGPLMLFGDAIVGRSSVPVQGREGATTLRAYDARTGAPLWQHAFDAPATCAATDGAIVCNTSLDLVVLGTTPASLRPIVQTPTRYPVTGEPARFDLSATGPGLFGRATAYRAFWGDGPPSDWQASPVLTHEYGLPGDYLPRFEVRNAGNQTASTTLALHVGQHDPAVTIWSDPFADRYQQTTFFVLGLLLTGAVALVGISRAGRKRRLLHRELRDLEADGQRLQGDGRAADQMLNRRKARARALFLERRLEEAHASFLASRIDEMRRELRLDTVDERLKFLPHGMVLHLQRLLADARVDAYEREHFLAALDQERSITKAQRAEVARLIDGWFARDASAG